MKKVLIVLLVACIIFSVVGCAQPATEETSASQSSADQESASQSVSESQGSEEVSQGDEMVTLDDKKICFLGAGSNTFGTALRKAAETKAQEIGIKMDYFNANGDIATQLTQIESAISNKYDAIILQSTDATGVNDAVDNIKAAGIPLVVVNMMCSNDAYDVYVGSNDVEAGRLQGEWLLEKTGGEAKIGLLLVYMGCSTQIERFQGLKEAFLDKAPDAEIVIQADGKAQRDEGMRIMEDWLLAYPEIDVIAAQNDSMALGAMQAILAANKKDDIIIAGVDADPDAVQAIIDGTFDMTVFQDANGQGSTAVETAVGLIQGKQYEKRIDIPFISVDITNAADYLE